jgi:chorismate mutase
MVDEYRSQIDVIDTQLLVLLNQRVSLAARVGTLKAKAGMPRRDKERERNVLARVLRTNTGPLDQKGVTKIFECIIAESRRAQNRLLKSV